MRKDNTMKVSIILCTYNGAEKIRETIESLLNQDYPQHKLEIIVVNDGSTDRTAEIIGKYPLKLINHGQNKGLGAARNTGISHASGEIVCFTDDDCRVDKNWVRESVNIYRESPNIDGIGGKIKPYKMDNILEKYAYYGKNPIYDHVPCLNPRSRIKNYLKKSFAIKRQKLKNGQKLASIMGANSSYRKEMLERVGGFDSTFRRGVDWEVNIRLNRIGVNLVYSDKIIVYHKHRVSLRSFLRHIYEYGKAYARVCNKHPEIKLIPYPVPLVFLLGIIANFFYPITIVCLFLAYYLKELPYLIKILRKTTDIKVLIFPFIDIAREFVYNLGEFAGWIELREL